MPCGDGIGADHYRIIEKRAEFDFPVSEHIWSGRTAFCIFAEEICKNAVPIFLREIYGIAGNVDLPADALHVVPVLLARTDTELIFFFPVFHENTDDIKSLFFQEQRGYG